MELFSREAQEVAPGAHLLPNFLSLEEQIDLLRLCRKWVAMTGGMTIPQMPDGKKMSVRISYLGHNWRRFRPGYAKAYATDDPTLPPPLPNELKILAKLAYENAFSKASDDNIFNPDQASLIWYDKHAKLGMHQDLGEAPEVIARGSPVISISLGNSAIFRFGNSSNRNRPYHDIELHSGDLFIFGGPSRLAFHGVLHTIPNSAPKDIGAIHGRLSVTIREAGFGKT